MKNNILAVKLNSINCCVFWAAFWCCLHPEASQKIYIFLYVSGIRWPLFFYLPKINKKCWNPPKKYFNQVLGVPSSWKLIEIHKNCFYHETSSLFQYFLELFYLYICWEFDNWEYWGMKSIRKSKKKIYSKMVTTTKKMFQNKISNFYCSNSNLTSRLKLL